MGADASTEPRPGSPEAGNTLRASAYVERALDAVLERLAGDLLTAALADALGDTEGGVIVVHAGQPVWVSAAHVRIPVTWSRSGPGAVAADGDATISLLVVQSGEYPITEVLATVPVSAAADSGANSVLRDTLHRLTERLEAVVRRGR